MRHHAAKSWLRRPRLQRPPRIDYVTWGREQMQAWLRDSWRDAGCTALLAQNDLAAIGAMQALQSAGIRVPEDVSVIGFEGTELCEYFAPRLSSVEVPLHEIGARAVKVLWVRFRHKVLWATSGALIGSCPTWRRKAPCFRQPSNCRKSRSTPTRKSPPMANGC